MPNNKQAKKRVRQNEKRAAENKVTRTSMRTAMKKVLKAETAEEAEKALPMAMKRIDKAAKKNIIHDNTAARYKSRMSRTAAAK
ncbi:MAG TPA: 30S ribosomal protein S20 [Planctomycetes bacterium]|nr:30S ribosomal protein S20 [Planctomycetota bacterium]